MKERLNGCRVLMVAAGGVFAVRRPGGLRWLLRDANLLSDIQGN